jgi:hypothetical protein
MVPRVPLKSCCDELLDTPAAEVADHGQLPLCRMYPFASIGVDRPKDRLAASGWRRQETSDPLCSPTLVVGASTFVTAT